MRGKRAETLPLPLPLWCPRPASSQRTQGKRLQKRIGPTTFLGVSRACSSPASYNLSTRTALPFQLPASSDPGSRAPALRWVLTVHPGEVLYRAMSLPALPTITRSLAFRLNKVSCVLCLVKPILLLLEIILSSSTEEFTESCPRLARIPVRGSLVAESLATCLRG
jgi:hypothetical protein